MGIDRRKFLSLAGTVSTALAADVGLAQTPPPQRVRKDVSQLPPNASDLLDYAKAVQIMTALPEGDRRNWRRQAEIHLQFCPHHNWWFLPWHRAYLWYFEQCCRDVLQNSVFCLPYWNWTVNPKVPGPFWSGSLLHKRAVTSNDDMPSEFVGPAKIKDILGSGGLTNIFSGATTTDEQREESAQGGLESGPHNSVHATILEDMGTYLSPLDPIFWLHHANIDRIWASWGRANPNRVPSEALWKDHTLQTFYDPVAKGNATPRTNDLKSPENWGAVYDKYEPVPAVATNAFTGANFVLAPTALASAAAGPLKLAQVATTLGVAGIKLGGAAHVTVNPTTALNSIWAHVPASKAGAPSAEAYLAIDGVTRPSFPRAGIRVFLNCKNPGTGTPLDDPTYVGSVAFFDGHDSTHGALTNFVLDASRTVRNLSALGVYKPGAPLDVALVVFDTSNPDRSQADQLLHPQRVRLLGVG